VNPADRPRSNAFPTGRPTSPTANSAVGLNLCTCSGVRSPDRRSWFTSAASVALSPMPMSLSFGGLSVSGVTAAPLLSARTDRHLGAAGDRLGPGFPVDDDLDALSVRASLVRSDIQVISTDDRTVAQRCCNDHLVVGSAGREELPKIGVRQSHDAYCPTARTDRHFGATGSQSGTCGSARDPSRTRRR
jgi:hypothetical protein